MEAGVPFGTRLSYFWEGFEARRRPDLGEEALRTEDGRELGPEHLERDLVIMRQLGEGGITTPLCLAHGVQR